MIRFLYNSRFGKQIIRVDESLSELCPMTHGAIQGLVLGPLIFLVHINSPFHVIMHAAVYLFANENSNRKFCKPSTV